MSERKSQDEIPFCGVSDEILAARAGQRWTKRKLLLAIQAQLPGILPQDLQIAYAQAIASWCAVCDLAASVVQGGAADIVADAGHIDGPFKVLAYSELPDGSDRRLSQRYDAEENWILSERPPQGKIDLLAVMTHELGHALGLDHSQPGSGDLMEPTYAPGRRVPQFGDVARIQVLYGKPAKPPTGGGTGEDDVMVILRGGMEYARYKLVRIDGK